jgi:ABC-type phosphate/phosphonate transport system substrate-binding protein
MTPARIASLPMYDFPELEEAHDALWAALSRCLIEHGLHAVPQALTRDLSHVEIWRHPRLLFAQGCEYPLAHLAANTVKLIATPRYTASGCEGANYRSAIVVRCEDCAQSLADLRDRRCVINAVDSNSGMNLLRASIAPFARGAPFFASVLVSGSHRHSVDMVAEGEADVAAVDCVSFAHFQRLYPAAVAGLRLLGWTPASPSLPFITAATTDDSTLQIVRASLARVVADRTLDGACQRLFLGGVDLQPAPHFSEVRQLERRAEELGYPVLC